jgi:hypothetical protein
MLRFIATCPECPKLAILTEVKIDKLFYLQVSGTTLSVRCPRCNADHTFTVKECKAYRVTGYVPPGTAAWAS